MASTRNRNTQGNYELEQWSLEQSRVQQSYTYQPNGQAITTHFAGDGLIGQWMPPTLLSDNSVDVESFLRGVGTTNLVSPKPDTQVQSKPIAQLAIFNKTPLMLPKPLYIEPEQRPLW